MFASMSDKAVNWVNIIQAVVEKHLHRRDAAVQRDLAGCQIQNATRAQTPCASTCSEIRKALNPVLDCSRTCAFAWHVFFRYQRSSGRFWLGIHHLHSALNYLLTVSPVILLR